MEINRINAELAVSPQLSTEDVKVAAEQGFRSIICNRPDGESADQPTFADIAAAAGAVGMEAVHQPVVGSSITPEDGVAFGRHLENLPKPVLAYCRSGKRCTVLHQLSQE